MAWERNGKEEICKSLAADLSSIFCAKLLLRIKMNPKQSYSSQTGLKFNEKSKGVVNN